MGDGNPSRIDPITTKTLTIKWYRCPIEPERLRALAKRSDAKGFLFVVGQLALLGGTAYLAHYFFVRQIWAGVALALWMHGTLRGVTHSGGHELAHGTVFRTKWLNVVFLRVWGVLAWFNFQHYKVSHTYHHIYTLHKEGDGEVVLPKTFSLNVFKVIELLTIDVSELVRTLAACVSVAVTGSFSLADRLYTSRDWSRRIFSSEQRAPLKRALRWPRILLAIHILGVVVAALTGFWMIPATLSLGAFIGRWYIYLLGATMHSGLRDNVPDFRLCTRTIKLNPFSGYLRWNMHYHIEHHMFAAIPCYNLPKLYRAVAFDMPKRRTLLEAWREIRETERRQRIEPSYQFDTPLPGPSGPPIEQDPLGSDIGDITPDGYAEAQDRDRGSG